MVTQHHPVRSIKGHDLLPQPAHIAGADGHWFLDSRKDRVIHGKIAESWVSGDVAAMDTLQRSSQTLCLVWTENRQDLSDPGVFSPGRDVAHLFTAHPDNTFLVRFAYWFTR